MRPGGSVSCYVFNQKGEKSNHFYLGKVVISTSVQYGKILDRGYLKKTGNLSR